MTIEQPEIPLGEAFAGFEVFEVGGGPRDRVRGVGRSDVDLLAAPRPGEVSDPVGVLEARMTRIDPEDSFPVFIDSEGREVALPRTEESTGQGFHDFDVSLVPPGTPVREAVEIDLERRDLSINAIAQNARTGEVIDPFGGVEAINEGIIEPVSDAFSEDPLRVVRMARFTARLLGADPTDEAVRVARETATNLDAVPVERFTMELRKGLKQADEPSEMFAVLDRVDAVEATFPSLSVVAADLSLVDCVESPKARLAALGIEGDAQVLVETQALTNDEGRAVGHADRLTHALATNPTNIELVEIASQLDSESKGLSITQAAELTSARSGRSQARIEADLRAAREAIESVSGRDVMNILGIEPVDIGDSISGDQFGQKLRELRAKAV